MTDTDSTFRHGDGETGLSRILSKLRCLDLTEHVHNKDATMDAHGGYCDIFVGHVHSDYVQQRLASHTTSGEVRVAIKRLRVRLSKDIVLAKSLAREVGIWSKLNHPNILPFLGYMFERDYPSLISEWIEHGTVRDFLRKNPPFDITYLALGIARGLEYLHDQNVVHSDMKPDNILINSSGEPLICDFGISRMLDSSQSNFVSTTHDHSVKSKESDVWAYGMTLYEIMTKQLPFAHLRDEARGSKWRVAQLFGCLHSNITRLVPHHDHSDLHRLLDQRSNGEADNVSNNILAILRFRRAWGTWASIWDIGCLTVFQTFLKLMWTSTPAYQAMLRYINRRMDQAVRRRGTILIIKSQYRGTRRMRRVRFDNKHIKNCQAADALPPCSNCLERGLECVDQFADMRPAHPLRHGRCLQQLSALYKK